MTTLAPSTLCLRSTITCQNPAPPATRLVNSPTPCSVPVLALSTTASRSLQRRLESQPAPQWRRLTVASVAEESVAEGSVEEGSSEEVLEYVGSDELLLYFKAEGTLSEAAIPRVTKALQACEGVENVHLSVMESCATAECTKTTTVQAATAASSLVEAIQSAGFGLQTICLGFSDDGTETAAQLFELYRSDAGEPAAEPAAPLDA